MLKAFALFIAIITPDGDLDVSTTHVEKCPSNAEMRAMGKDLVDTGLAKNWAISCTAIRQFGA